MLALVIAVMPLADAVGLDAVDRARLRMSEVILDKDQIGEPPALFVKNMKLAGTEWQHCDLSERKLVATHAWFVELTRQVVVAIAAD